MRLSKYAQFKTFWIGKFQEEETIYKTDENGEIVYIYVSGVGQVPVELGKRPAGYKIVGSFNSNFQTAGGEIDEAVYGLSDTDFAAKIVTPSTQLNLTVEDLLWEEEPEVDSNGNADGNTASFRIIAIRESRNFDTYLLDAVTK